MIITFTELFFILSIIFFILTNYLGIGIFRPNIVMFEEDLPKNIFNEANKLMSDAYIILIIGTSGQVYPAANLPLNAFRNGATLIEINPIQSTTFKQIISFFIQLSAVEGMIKISKFL